jgi:hypothetical protein
MVVEVAAKSRPGEIMTELAQVLSGRELPKPPAKYSIFSGKFPMLRKK